MNEIEAIIFRIQNHKIKCNHPINSMTKMTEYLVTKWFGSFLLNEKGVKEKRLFPKNAEEIAKRLLAIQNGEILEEERELAKGKPIVGERRLESLGILDSNKMIQCEIASEKYDFDDVLLHEASIIAAEKKIKKEGKKKEKERQIEQLVKAMDDLLHISNLLSERLREWRNFKIDGKELAKIVNESGEYKKDIQPIRSLAKILLETLNVEKEMEKHIEEGMLAAAPNISELVGTTLGARLISLAGGVEKLAFMPSSTIQLLGAERALFRHLKSDAPPPKHGVIFQHELINRAPREQRGKIARALAAKISIAAKADAFTKKNIVEKLKMKLDERLREIEEK